jgi:hypothetical protein
LSLHKVELALISWSCNRTPQTLTRRANDVKILGKFYKKQVKKKKFHKIKQRRKGKFSNNNNTIKIWKILENKKKEEKEDSL